LRTFYTLEILHSGYAILSVLKLTHKADTAKAMCKCYSSNITV